MMNLSINNRWEQVFMHLIVQIAIYQMATMFAYIGKIPLKAAIFTHHFIQMMTSMAKMKTLFMLL